MWLFQPCAVSGRAGQASRLSGHVAPLSWETGSRGLALSLASSPHPCGPHLLLFTSSCLLLRFHLLSGCSFNRHSLTRWGRLLAMGQVQGALSYHRKEERGQEESSIVGGSQDETAIFFFTRWPVCWLVGWFRFVLFVFLITCYVEGAICHFSPFS